MKIAYANTIPLRKILFKIGLKPQKKVANTLIYLSPFDIRNKAALKVDLTNNTWFDEALNYGGNVIAFLSFYLQGKDEAGTEADALRWLKNIFQAPAKIVTSFAKDYSEADAHYELRTMLPLMHPGLLRYVDARKIDRRYAFEYLREVRVFNRKTKKVFRAVALRNEDGGFAVRNPCRKANIGPVAIKFIRGQSQQPKAIHIFKDIFDYLATLTARKGHLFEDDVIILSSYHSLNDASGYIRNYGYKTAYFWLENTPEGVQATRALSTAISREEGLICKRMNSLYAGYKCPNDWWVAKCTSSSSGKLQIIST